MQKFFIKDHAPSLLPEGGWKLVWNDEFDGDTLDESKWGFRLNYWGKPAPHFTREGVVVKDGCVELHCVKRPDGEYAAPFLQTGSLTYDIPMASRGENCGAGWFIGPKETPKFMHKYGYYECRCKLQKMPGWWSAFWLQAPGIGATLDIGHDGVECDIMESFRPGEVIPHWLHANGYGEQYKGTSSHPEGTHDENSLHLDLDEWHTFGCEWAPDGYTFYVDGVQHGRKVIEMVSHTEQFVLISTECIGYRRPENTGVPDLAAAVAANDCFTVDYVRVFDRMS